MAKISDDLNYTDTSTSVPCDDEIDCKLASLELALIKEEVIKDTEIPKLLEVYVDSYK